MNKNGLIDGVINEPLGGAHRNHEEIFVTVKQEILKHLNNLNKLTPENRIDMRIQKFSSMGVVSDLELDS
jgi:acetyl-CoA carboxylase carboxyl transferase subunit alpha